MLDAGGGEAWDVGGSIRSDIGVKLPVDNLANPDMRIDVRGVIDSVRGSLRPGAHCLP